MIAFFLGLFAVPLVDQAVKIALLRRLDARSSVRLGLLGHLRIVRTQMWIRRGAGAPSLAALWGVWAIAATALAWLCSLLPAFGIFAGLLAGASLSHALETSVRGCICDYVCLRFWPAFNLADVALTAGAMGTLSFLLTLART
jgi:lipoprotein signal peptidase